jgi:hypothetical protein
VTQEVLVVLLVLPVFLAEMALTVLLVLLGHKVHEEIQVQLVLQAPLV